MSHHNSGQTERQCRQCKQVLPIEQFGQKRDRRRGENYRYRYRTCRTCKMTPAKQREARGERQCRRCQRVLPLDKFAMRTSRHKSGKVDLYRRRTCNHCLAKPEKTPLVNSRGERRCKPCGQYRPPTQFYKGDAYCKECRKAINYQASLRRALDNEWWAKTIARHNARQKQRALVARQQRTEIAFRALQDLRSRGITIEDITKLTRISRPCLYRLRDGHMVTRQYITDRLAALQTDVRYQEREAA